MMQNSFIMILMVVIVLMSTSICNTEATLNLMTVRKCQQIGGTCTVQSNRFFNFGRK